jgi:hypothetical protein
MVRVVIIVIVIMIIILTRVVLVAEAGFAVRMIAI